MFHLQYSPDDTMKLANQLSLSFFLVALIIVGIGGLVFINSKAVGESFTQVQKGSVPQILSLERIKTYSTVVYSRALEYTVEEDLGERKDYVTEMNEARADYDQTMQSLSDAERGALEPIHQSWLSFNVHADKVLALVDAESAEDIVAKEREQMELDQEAFVKLVDDRLDSELAQNAALEAGVQRALDLSYLLTILTVAAAALFSVAFGRLVAGKISKPVIKLRDALDGLARGRFDIAIPPSGYDEIADLVTHFDHVRDQLSEKEKMQQEFLMVAAHELRTPIQPILGYSDLAAKGQVSHEKAFEVISSEARRLKELSDNLLDASKIDGGRMNFSMSDVDISRLVREIAEQASMVLRSENPAVAVTTLHAIPEPSIVLADEKLLKQALWNIVNNARKFTAEGSITLSCSPLVYQGVHYVELKIADTGTGIPKEVLPNLFKKFASKDTNKETRNGTGLGLYITKGIVESHNGKISAAPNLPRGTVVTILLPVKEARPALKDAGAA